MQKKCITGLFFLFLLPVSFSVCAQVSPPPKASDATSPLHALPPEYPVAYGAPTAAGIKSTLDRIYHYLDGVTPAQLVDRRTGQPLADVSRADTNTIFAPGDFRLLSYEWGVVYAGMLQATEATGDTSFAQYTYKRQQLIARSFPALRATLEKYPEGSNALRFVVHPRALDDCGAVCASMIKALRHFDPSTSSGQAKLSAGSAQGGLAALRPVIDNFIQYISSKEFRLPDGTLARNRPHPNTLWL
ncbi:MAG TPA: hypothetical protein VLD19_08030, partial [Chitinophagaceae bacterium]|nr:hypothetical protein [Chitinophagaceae bacterium]